MDIHVVYLSLNQRREMNIIHLKQRANVYSQTSASWILIASKLLVIPVVIFFFLYGMVIGFINLWRKSKKDFALSIITWVVVLWVATSVIGLILGLIL